MPFLYSLTLLIASPIIIKIKGPALVYQVLYDLTPGPLSHLITHYLCSADRSSALLGSRLVLWYVGNMFFCPQRKVLFPDTFWRYPSVACTRPSPQHLTHSGTLVILSACPSAALIVSRHYTTEETLVNNGLEFSKWTMEEEHSEERGGSKCCKSECP